MNSDFLSATIKWRRKVRQKTLKENKPNKQEYWLWYHQASRRAPVLLSCEEFIQLWTESEKWYLKSKDTKHSKIGTAQLYRKDNTQPFYVDNLYIKIVGEKNGKKGNN